ncbi:ABC transporter substrate-binding protein [Cumulibacter manganitolerans]|uniref:ABC transporter substrate-binding protein n=1 Tax=Cumulibacter manganitolerans TaxID=1884992 RepID=UPI0012968C8F|nr:ABC transporter substrate-binding protein [Cumulibacter manganitolerans]
MSTRHDSRFRKPGILLALASALLLLVSACGGGASGAAQKVDTDYGDPVSGGELRIGYALSPSSLDPLRGGAGSDHVTLYPIYDRLVNFDDEMKPVPSLAKSWENPDPKTLVLHLQQGVTFHDGTPFNADAVKFNLDRGRTNPVSNVKAELASVTSVDVVDDATVKLALAEPDSSLLLKLADRAGMMASPAALQSDPDALTKKPVGTGPFSFVSFSPGDSLVLEKNQNYWQDGKPYLDKLAFKFMTNTQTLVNSIQGGQVDFVTRLNAQTYKSLNAKSDLVVSADTSLGVDGCYINASMAPTDNLQLRQAMAYAIDYEGMKNSLTFGAGGEIASGLFPKDYWAHPSVEWPYKYDVKKAKELVAESGVENPEVNVVGFNGPGEQRKLEIIQGYLKAVGITMNINIEEVGTATADYVAQKFGMYCASWTGRPDPSQTYDNLLSPTGYFNGGKYAEPGVEQALSAGNEVTGLKERVSAFDAAAQYEADTLLFLPMVHVPLVTAYAPKVKGYYPSLYGKADPSFLWIGKKS